ncbi:MAG TPA: hypothetical protein VE684_20825 [Crenalkalicoccus sp.]|nr:hypothetical protein [Crenalkalicoccus sp.]
MQPARQAERPNGRRGKCRLKVVALVEAVAIPMVAQLLDESRQFRPQEIQVSSARAMLDELARWAEALRPLRQPG